MNHDPSFEIRFDSLDFFGSFFYQEKNEQEEIKVKIVYLLSKLGFNG